MDANYASRGMQAVLVMAVVGLLVGPARAEVLEISAECRAQVTERVGGQATTVDSELQRYPETTGVLPMRAEAGITNEVDTEIMGLGLCFTQFKDPRSTTSEVPDELNVDAATFSGEADLDYEVIGIVVERRSIRPTANETKLADGTEVILTSDFYVQGLLVAAIVSDDPNTDLTGLLARVEVTVVHTRASSAPETVLLATYELVGQADGSVKLGTQGVARTKHVVNLNLSDRVTELGKLRVAILPSVKLGYEYLTAVGETSELAATLRVRLLSLPDGTGVGAAFGMPGERIGQTVDAVLGGAAGVDTVRTINNVIAGLPEPAIKFLREPRSENLNFLGFLGSLCGLLGAEAVVGFVFMLGWVGIRARRR